MREEWKRGYPNQLGIYKARVDSGEPVPLVHKECRINGRHRWMTIRGEDVIGSVEWTGEPLGCDDLEEFT